MVQQRWGHRRLRYLGCVFAWAMMSRVPYAEEIKPFSFKAGDGNATLRYLRDDYRNEDGTPGGGSSHQQQADWRMEVNLSGRGYAYHPNLISFEVDGGPILERQNFLSDDSTTRYAGSQYNLSLKANLLRDKPYRSSFYYDHLNPTQSLAPGVVIRQESRRYGGELSLLAPLTPVPVVMAWNRGEVRGRGADRVVDDDLDQLSLRATPSFGPSGNAQFLVQSQQQRSASGSALSPIQQSNSRNDGLTLDTQLRLGDARDIDLTQLFSMNRRSYASAALRIPTQSDVRLMLDLRRQQGRNLIEFVNFDTSRNRQGELDTYRHSLGGGVNYRPAENVELAGTLREESDRSTDFSSDSRSASGSANYTMALGPGRLQASVSRAVEERDQQAASDSTAVIGEAITLAGFQQFALAHAHVIPGSIKVSGAARTQVYIEGLDYQILVVGTETRIQRLVGGIILDGEPVEVDYRYETGGTYAYRMNDSSLSLGWSWGRYIQLSWRRMTSHSGLLSGTPAFPLNDITDTVWALHWELPLWNTNWSIGSLYEYELRDETVAPYRRDSVEAYLQTDEADPDFGSMHFGARRLRIDYGNPLQNVDLTGYDLRWSLRHGAHWDFSANANLERDDGGLLPRRRLDASLKAQWRERKLTMTFSLARVLEIQGVMRRTPTLLQWQLRRDF